jgi:RimJ/RimL family protein N-acetyltransferase
MFQEDLVGQIVTLKTLHEDHFQSYHDMLSSIIKEAIGIPKEQTFEETERFLKKKLIEIANNTILFYCVFDNKKNELIGAIELREPGFFNGQLGGWINENYWGGGRYQEALDLLIQKYFASTDQHVVNAYIKKRNTRSLNAHEKYGFKIIREFEKDGIGFYELIYEK